jgi:hypothetical protein
VIPTLGRTKIYKSYAVNYHWEVKEQEIPWRRNCTYGIGKDCMRRSLRKKSMR